MVDREIVASDGGKWIIHRAAGKIVYEWSVECKDSSGQGQGHALASNVYGSHELAEIDIEIVEAELQAISE